MSDEIVLKWAWRYHALDVERCDNIEEAVRWAEIAAENGDEAFDCIEIISIDGTTRLLTKEEYDAIAEPRGEAQNAEYRDRPAIVAALDLKSPRHDDWVCYETFNSKIEADAKASALRAAFGDRLRVRQV